MSITTIAPAVLRATATADSRELRVMPGPHELRLATLHVEDSDRVEFPYVFSLAGWKWSADIVSMDNPKPPDDCYVANIEVRCISHGG